VEPTGRFKYTIVTHHYADGSATCEGIDLAPETIDAIAPDAMLKTRIDDETGFPIHTTRARRALPSDVERHVRERDPHCRVRDEICHLLVVVLPALGQILASGALVRDRARFRSHRGRAAEPRRDRDPVP